MNKRTKLRIAKVVDTVADNFRSGKWGWTKGANARDEKGYSVPVGSDKAVAFCLYGGVAKAVKDTEATIFYDTLGVLKDEIPDYYVHSIEGFNDDSTTTKRKMLAFLRRVSKKLREE